MLSKVVLIMPRELRKLGRSRHLKGKSNYCTKNLTFGYTFQLF